MARGSCPVTKARNEGPPSGPPVVAAQGWLTSLVTNVSPAANFTAQSRDFIAFYLR